jgi:hypothetical protein
MARPRLDRDRLGGDGAEPEAHRALEDRGIVVHRGEDDRVGQRHSAQGDRQQRIDQPEMVQPIDGHETQEILAEGDRGRFGQTREEGAVEEPVEGRDRSAHAGDRVEG